MNDDEPMPSSMHLSPIPPYRGDSDSQRSNSPEPDSPSASAFLRTAATLDGLARQLGDLSQHSRESSLDEDTGGRCCCGAASGSRACSTVVERDKMEERMKLSGGESWICFGSDQPMGRAKADGCQQRSDKLYLRGTKYWRRNSVKRWNDMNTR
jgi:hypothetical protein